MTTFATVGKKVDDHITDFGRKVHEVKEAFEDSIKSFERKGFERGLRAAAALVNAPTMDGAKLVDAIRKIQYTPAE